MSDLTSAGGSLSIVVLALGALGLVVMLGLAGVALTKRRVPLTALVIVPVMICGVGALGAWSTAGGALGDLALVDADEIVFTAKAGVFDALSADVFSRWVAAFLFGVGSWAAALGAFMAGPDTRMTPIAAGGSAILTLLGAGIVAYYAAAYGIASVTPMIALILFSGFGVAFSALRRALYEDAHRVAGMRFASAMCMLLAISYGSRALTDGNRMTFFGPDGLASQADGLAAAILTWNEVAAPVITVSWIAFAFALMIAFAGFYYELGEVVEKFSLLDVTATLVILTMLGGVRLLQDSRVDDLTAVETSSPATELFADLGTDLPSALLEIDENNRGVRPSEGGFGDVLQFDETDKIWKRVRAWNGSDWTEDDTPLEQVTDLSKVRPLLVAKTGDPASDIPAMLEAMGGRALLLLRAEEVKQDQEIPSELAYLQVTFLPLELTEERRLEKELWMEAGAKEVNWGATSWYGDLMDEEPIEYMTAAFTETEAEGLQVLLGEKSRIKGPVMSCLPALMDRVEEELKAMPSDKWCHVSAGEYDEALREAMEATEVPATEHFRGRVGSPTALVSRSVEGGGAFIADRIRREFGAVDYCFNVALEEGEEMAGPMQLLVKFSRKGTARAEMHPRSKNTNDMAFRCVKDRMKQIELLIDEEVWPEPEYNDDGEVINKTVEQLDLLLDIRG